MSNDSPKPRRRFWRRVRRVILLLILVVAAWWGWTWWHGRVRIGPDTTVLSGPLNPDGTVNYVAALDAEWAKGVTTENNAAPILIMGLGPEALGPAYRQFILAALGLTNLPDTGEYFVDYDAFCQQADNLAQPTTRPQRPPGKQEANLGRLRQRPWRQGEFPGAAAWLDAMAKPLAAAIVAGRRTRFYLPVIDMAARPSMEQILAPVVLEDIRKLGWALCCRAMLRAGEGQIDAAWYDIQGVYRLARVLTDHPSLFGQLSAILTAMAADKCLRGLALSGALDSNQTRELLKARQAIRIPIDVVSAIDRCSRYCSLEYIVWASRGAWHGIESIGPLLRWMPVDWNRDLRTVNSWYDQMVRACRLTPWRESSAAVTDLWDGQIMPVYMAKWQSNHVTLLFKQGPTRFALSLLAASAIASTDGRSPEFAARQVMSRELTVLTLALAAYRAEHGVHPEKLDELAPGYLKEIPLDVFTDQPLVYNRTADGYLLYSVGPNMADDGGKNRADKDAALNSDADDIAVQCPPAAD
ncbi:MAG: hypothetical protein BIFFINMI_01927 [Phycisphaerae bacterium]|nr:hypothetical protein [Phycisphaerae bacterium]